MSLNEIREGISRPEFTAWYVAALERLIDVVQDLSHTRNLEAVMGVVRKAARDLTGADGATFVLREEETCYYAEENAISPLWKGQRFPMNICISGWVMRHGKPVVIEDIYQDPRIPTEAYRPTFVKSLAMVPIRAENPIGAIGNYWATHRQPAQEEVTILQALAHVISVAMENVDLYARLQEKIQALEKSNFELSSFAWAASHDLKTPLRAIDVLSTWIEEDWDSQDPEKTKGHLHELRHRVRGMEKFLDDILEYAQVDYKLALEMGKITDGRTLQNDILALIELPEGFTLSFSENFSLFSGPGVPLQRIFCNLISNAIKHHDRAGGFIEVDVKDQEGQYLFSVRDDGPGIPPDYQAKIFGMFQSLKPHDLMESSGMGLPLVKKIVSLYGGEVTLISGPDRGAVFQFSWPKAIGASAEKRVS
jgi:signal transduction histidine kinase